MTIKTRTEELLEIVRGKHEWQEGRIYGGQGDLNVKGRDTCSVCGLERHWFSYHTRPNEYQFFNSKGVKLSLKEAAELEC